MNAKRNSYVAIVDDDESICRSFGRLLRTAGFQPIVYPSAEAFLDDNRRPIFDCLLLDLQLAGISGLELSRRLAAVNDTTPVIFITAQDEPEESAAAKASGCAGFFHKTAPGSTIIQAIAQAVHCAEISPTRVDPTLPDEST
jgi:FixJ family two-component response regulator